MAKVLFANNIKTPFVSLNAGDTTLAVTDDAGFPIISGGNFFYLTLFNLNGSLEENIEIVKVTAKITTNVYTIERGQDGTSDVAHSSTLDNYAGLRLTAGIADRFVQSADGTISNDNWSGADLTIANGGTGASTAQVAINNLVGGTVTNGFVLRGNGTNAVMAAIQASDIPTLNQNTTGTAANVTGIVAIANGGTGAATQAAALTALCGTSVVGTYPRGNGVNVVMSAIQASDVPTLNQNTTGTASNVTGVVAITNGGTGQSNATEAFDALAPTTTLGDIIFRNATDNVRLAGNTTIVRQFLSQLGTGTASAAPAWRGLVDADIPSVLSGKTYNGLSLTSAGTGWTIAGGTTSKTLTLSNTLTLSGTDSSTLNIGAGGTLGSAAFTASSAYEPAFALLANSKGGTGQDSSAWNGIPKVTSGTWSIATAGTDYLAPSAIGTTVQAYDAGLQSISGLTTAADNIIYTTASDTYAVTTLTSFGRGLIDDADASAGRTTLGLGTIATQAASNVAITGGTINGTTVGATTPASGTFTSLTDSGNLNFTGTGNRITGDFSNATVANRVNFQTSTTNGGTYVSTLPLGTGNISGFFAYNAADGDNASVLGAYLTSAVSIINASKNGTGTYLPMTFHTGGSERVRIDTSGNVGIGGIPDYKLDIFSGALRLNFNARNVAGDAAIYFGSNSNNSIFSGNVSNIMAFGTNGSERMRIDNAGNVGIGTSSPITKLDTIGNVFSRSSGTTDFGLVGAVGNDYSTSFRATYLRQSDFATTGTTAGFSNAGLGTLVFQNTSNALIYTNGATPLIFGTTLAERMRIDASGNVGIGTSTAGSKVYISQPSTTAYGFISQTPTVGLTAGNYVNMAYFTNNRSTNNDGLRIVNLRDSTGSGVGNWETESYRIRRSIDANDGSSGVQEEIIFGNNTLGFSAGGSERLRLSADGAIGLSGANYGTASTQAIVSNGSASAPTWQTVAIPTVAQNWTQQQTFKEVKDTVHTITDGAAFEIDPGNGSIQTIVLGANRTPAATNFEAGQCVLLGIDDGTAFTITWSTVAVTWVKAGGTASAPTLATTGFTWVLLWKVGSTVYGTEVGKP